MVSDTEPAARDNGDALVADDLWRDTSTSPQTWKVWDGTDWQPMGGSSGGGSGGGAYAETIGDGTEASFDVVHNLDTADVVVQVWDVSVADPALVEAAVVVADVDTVTVTFDSAPDADQYRVVVLASGATGGDGSTFEMVHVVDEKASGTHGGAFNSGAWRTRDLNTVRVNEITGASLASNVLTLPAGEYVIEWSAPAASGNTTNIERHQTRLYDVTGGAMVEAGTSEMSARRRDSSTRAGRGAGHA